MEAGFENLEPSGALPSASPPLNEVELSYRDRLALRPWESETALQRLDVPLKLFPGYCPVITKWVVLTGATCAGKTTLITELDRRGYPVLHEVARAYVEDEVKKGREVPEIRADDVWFRQQVFSLTLDTEINLLSHAHELIFFDRSAVDSLSFHRGSGYNPHEILNQLQSYRYAQVFHCNPLPFVDDGLRTANEERRLFLDAALARDYKALGYRPVRIPYASVEERVKRIFG